MGFFKNLKQKARMKMAPVAPFQPMPVKKPLGIERLVNRDSNIDFGIDFSRRSGSGGFRPIGDGRLAPISGSVNPGFNMEPKDPQKRTALQDAFAKLQQQLRNQQQPQPLERVDMPSVPQIPTRESIKDYVRNNVDFSRLPRMMMAEGRDANIVDFLNADPEQVIFGIDVELDNLEKQLDQAQMNNDRDAIDMIGDEMNDLMFERIKIKNSMIPDSGRTVSDLDRDSLDDILSSLEKKN